jgi:replicative DNA helicase
LHRPEQYDPADRPGEAELLVAKHRNGPTGLVRMSFKKQHMQFQDYVGPDAEMPSFGGGDGF